MRNVLYYKKAKIGEINIVTGRIYLDDNIPCDLHKEVIGFISYLTGIINNSYPEGDRLEQFKIKFADDIMQKGYMGAAINLDELTLPISLSYADDRTIYRPLVLNSPGPLVVTSNISLMRMKSPNKEKHFSFSGCQDKLTAILYATHSGYLEIREPNKMYEVGNTIVKPLSRKHRFLPQNEYLNMSFAKEVGLHTPSCFLIRDSAGDLHFGVERFDIDGEPAQKMPVMEFAAICERTSEQKYEYTTEALFQKAGECLDSQSFTLFAKSYLYGYIIGNSDMHLKNFSVYIHPDRIGYELTPLYDMVNVKAAMNSRDDLALSLAENTIVQEEDFTDYITQFLSYEDILSMTEILANKYAAMAEKIFSIDNNEILRFRYDFDCLKDSIYKAPVLRAAKIQNYIRQKLNIETDYNNEL